ncbi:hypothetical protein ACNO6Z_10685 [Aliarcobacter lanthieri]
MRKIIRMLKTARAMFIIAKERNELEVARFWGNECIKLSSKLKGY